MSKKLKSKPKFSITKLIGIGLLVVIAAGAYYGYQSLIPVNMDHPVFLVPENILIKTGKTADGQYSFGLQSSRGGKQAPQRGMTSPTLTISKGNLVSFHIINEILNTPEAKSIHNFNIDEFNVHSKDLEYFDSQSITFLADKTGEFTYHCTLHPEMKGLLIVK
jgi:hypothetical protein